MSTLIRAAALSPLLIGFGGWAAAAEPNPFATATVHFEQNASDGDMEVVFEVKAGKDGLAELTVVSPDGRTVAAFKAPDASTLGMRQFRFESPEPADLAAVRAAYPEGAYQFAGKTAAGAVFVGKATLSHRLPATTSFVQPAPQAATVALNKPKIAWQAVAGVASYVVEIKQEELNAKFSAQLPASATSVTLPDGFLAPGRAYKLSIGTLSRDGNASFVETTFTATPQ